MINESFAALENWFYDHVQVHYPLDDVLTFEEWVNSLTNKELVDYLCIGEDIVNDI